MQVHYPLFQVLDSFYKLSEETKNALSACIKVRSYSKGSFILEQGMTNDKLYFLKKGVVRAFYYQGNKELTSWMFAENSLFISIYSFLTQTPSRETIEAVEDCELFYITNKDLQELYTSHLDLNVVGRKLTEMYYIKMTEQAGSLRMLPAKERYAYFLETQGALLNRVPLGYIASYLGMSQETLSRVRQQLYS
ncbi:MAG: Crp/Fnr family transcriptional regulator [Bacteroidota bacterium]